MIKDIYSTGLPVGEKLFIRKNVLHNGTGNGRVCIVTGTHGDELEGQLVCYEMVRRIKENMDLLDGTVEVYPALNPLGIDSLMRGIPNFDLDMNRIFPGDMDGSMAEQAAYKIVEDLRGADLVIDVHSSNLYLREMPQVRINVNDKDKLVPLAKELNVDFIWVHDAATVLEATLAHSLNSTGTKCLVEEMGVGMRVNRGMCFDLVDGIFNIMNKMGIWKEPVFKGAFHQPVVCQGDTVEFLNAEASGVFLTDVHTGIIVEENQEIGRIVDPLTADVLSVVKSPCKGLLFTVRAYPVVCVGSLMARIFKDV